MVLSFWQLIPVAFSGRVFRTESKCIARVKTEGKRKTRLLRML